MKTLDEVIKALEWCVDDSHDDCDGCPYDTGEVTDCHDRNVDALHYLKTIETTENLYHDAVNELSKWKDEDWKDRCLPLTWDELKQMEGKPVWVECKFYSHQWAIIGEVTENRIRFYGHQLVDGEPQEEMGQTWQAYRKERHENAR